MVLLFKRGRSTCLGLEVQPMIPLNKKRFDIFPPCVGCSEGLDLFRFLSKLTIIPKY